jgi:hypothetical protein
VPFVDGPSLHYIARGKFVTDTPTVYVGQWDVLTVPAGFQTDLASVPRLFWALLPPQGAYERAAVLHDWLCTELGRYHREREAWLDGHVHDPPLPPPVNARHTDGLFRRVMREADEVPNAVAWVMWAGVRWGALFNPARREGWWHWRSAVPTLGITAALTAALYYAVRALDHVAHSIL